MDFALSEEQEMLKKSARDFLSAECPKSLVRQIEVGETGYSPELWKKMAALGWMGLPLPEKFGGAELKLLNLAVLFEEFGRAAVPGPMFCTVALGALPIMDWGTEEQRKTLLPKVASGELILTMALSEPEVNEDPRFIAAHAIQHGDNLIINGTKLFVPYAHLADYLLLVIRTKGVPGDDKGISIIIVDRKTNGTKLTPLYTMAVDRQFEVKLERVSAQQKDVLGSLHEGLLQLRETLKKATVLQCAEMVGGAQQELEITAEHTKNRIQFERPIGTFQAVQHCLADMFVNVNGARWATYQAVWRLSEGLPADREVAIAKAFANIACQRVAFSAQQLHGGVGLDKDYDLHFYFRRAKAYALTLGSTPFHLRTFEAEMSR